VTVILIEVSVVSIHCCYRSFLDISWFG